ncbi:MAG TPA: glycosyltransferase family 4 protein [Dehalococcoidia bacterium]|nr:glycosyltransferase family 4 protein [Dehalococcoidia bacterium]
MKILMLAPQPFFEPRGTPFSVLGRLKALSALGHEVDLLTYHIGKDVTIPGVVIHRTPNIRFIKAVKIGPSLPKILLDLLLLFKAIQLLRKNSYDLLHTHEEAAFFGIVLSRIFRIPHLYDMHSSLTQQLSNFRYSKFAPLVRFFDWMEHRVINSSNAVITICPALEEHVTQINGQVPQVMIENMDTSADPALILKVDVEALAAAHPGLEGRRIVLYAGTFEAYQGIDLLVESAGEIVRQCENVMFVMVGGKPAQVEFYQRLVDSKGLGDHFHFTGTRPPEEIPIFIKLAHVLVSPRVEGTNTPLKIYSYLQSGKPIVATDLYTHTQVLNRDVAVLVTPSAAGLAEGILSVLENSRLATEVGNQARKFFEANYSMEKYISKTDQVLRAAVAG